MPRRFLCFVTPPGSFTKIEKHQDWAGVAPTHDLSPAAFLELTPPELTGPLFQLNKSPLNPGQNEGSIFRGKIDLQASHFDFVRSRIGRLSFGCGSGHVSRAGRGRRRLHAASD